MQLRLDGAALRHPVAPLPVGGHLISSGTYVSGTVVTWIERIYHLSLANGMGQDRRSQEALGRLTLGVSPFLDFPLGRRPPTYARVIVLESGGASTSVMADPRHNG